MKNNMSILCRVVHGLFSNKKPTRNNPEIKFSGFFPNKKKSVNCMKLLIWKTIWVFSVMSHMDLFQTRTNMKQSWNYFFWIFSKQEKILMKLLIWKTIWVFSVVWRMDFFQTRNQQETILKLNYLDFFLTRKNPENSLNMWVKRPKQ